MGFKLYNGCPNGELQEYWDAIDSAKKYIRSKGYCIAYFPLESVYYMCHADTYKEVGNPFRSPMEAQDWLKQYLGENHASNN